MATNTLLKALFRHAELQHVVELISPAFWQVVPPREVWRTGKQLLQNARDESWNAGLSNAVGSIAGLRMRHVRELSGEGIALRDTPNELRQKIGQSLLQLYFRQLLYSESAVLDLAPERFRLLRADESAWSLEWAPRSYHYRWPDAFLGGLREVYRGFYCDQPHRFDEGIAALRLTPSKDIFRRQFGENQEAVRFETADLISNLHESFVRCKEEKQQLSGSFLALGFYLTTLYQSLETLGVALNARTAFSAADNGLDSS